MKTPRLFLALLFASTLASGQMLWTKPPVNDSSSGGAAGSFTTVTASSKFIAADGASNAPSYTFSSNTGHGFYYASATAIGMSIAGTNIGFITNLGLYGNALVLDVANQDAFIQRCGANNICIKSVPTPTTAQILDIYGTSTGPKYLRLTHDGTNGVIDTSASAGILSLAPTNATGVTVGKALTQATSITSSTATFPITGLAAAAGGSVSLIGGAGSSTTGGNVIITGGAATSGAGSSVTITAGAAAGGTNSGGNVNLVPTVAVSTGTPGEVQINSARGFFEACWQQFLPANVPVTATSYSFFLANRAYRVVAASIIASSTTTPTVDVFKDSGTNAPGAGATVLTAVMTFSGTANTRVTGTPSATVSATNIAAGDRLSAKWGGTVGALTGGMLCVTLVPI